MITTLMGALKHQVDTRPKKTAFVFGEDTWSYERLAAEVGRLTRGLRARGLRRGDRVALHMMNRPEMLVAYYACFQLGVIAAPLKTAFKPAELEALLQRLQPALYLGEVGLCDNIASVEPGLLPFEKRFTVGGAVDDNRVQRWEDLLDNGPGDELSLEPDKHAPAVLINTSGTTGFPKFVTHTSSTLAETTELVVRHFGLERGDVVIEQLPVAHMSGLFTFLSFVRLGAPFILLTSFEAGAVLDTIERYRVTWFGSFPAQFSALLEEQRVRPRKLYTLRQCLNGVDVCPVGLQEQISNVFGIPMRNFWGATEAVGCLIPGLKSGPVSQIVSDARVRLIDEDGSDVPHGETGELLVRGPNVFVGYWNDPDATSAALHDGWYQTGDMMRRGERDEIWFVSRKKDLIVRAGAKISPLQVERELAAHAAVQEAAVVGLPDPVLGQRVFGFVKLTAGTKPSVVSEILAAATTRLADYKVPEGLCVTDELPRNTLGKLDRKALLILACETDRPCFVGATLQSKRIGNDSLRANHITAPTRFIEVNGIHYAYRRFGADFGVPLIFLQHFRGGMDHWDPLLTDGLGQGRPVILFNNAGVASSAGEAADTIDASADHVAAFLVGLGLSMVDVLGFSMGGYIAQSFVIRHPHLVRRLVLVGTGPRNGEPSKESTVPQIAGNPTPTLQDFLFLFFSRSGAGQAAGKAFWDRRHRRTDDVDPPTSPETMRAQLTALKEWRQPRGERFSDIKTIGQPTLVVNGSNDIMVPTINSFNLAQNIPNAQLIIYPDSGHGAHFQYPELFVAHARMFLEAKLAGSDTDLWQP
jgi:long-chain acyl-CoA synthetase